MSEQSTYNSPYPPNARKMTPEAARLRARRRRGGGWDYILWFFCTLMTVTAWGASYGLYAGVRGKSAGGITGTLAAMASAPFGGRERVNFLIMGTDDKVERGRSDTMILATINVQTGHVVLLSIPRDSYAYIPGHGEDRINAAYVFGGPELAVSSVENLLHVHVDHYVRTNFEGFQKIIDQLGGIKIDVDKRMRYRDRSQDLDIDLHPGRQLLDGYDAMCYVRFRKDGCGDIGRIARQQKFLRAVARKMLSPLSLPKLPGILHDLSACVTTDMTSQDLMSLARVARKISTNNIETAMLPGEARMIGGRSLWIVSDAGVRSTLGEMQASLSGDSRPEVNVMVLNGCGKPGVARHVADDLQQAGFRVLGTGNAQTFQYRTSRIVTHCPSRDVGERVRAALRCGNVCTDSAARQPDGADVTVIIGQDFDNT